MGAVKGGSCHLLLLLELARGFDPEVVGEGSGDGPGGEVAPPAEAAQRVAHERPRVPHRTAPPARRRHLPLSSPVASPPPPKPPRPSRAAADAFPTPTALRLRVSYWSARKKRQSAMQVGRRV